MHLHIAFAADNAYAQHLGISMISLFDTNMDFGQITVHILENDIEPQNRRHIDTIAKNYNRNVKFYNLKGVLADLRRKHNIPDTISITAYGRLFISQFLASNIQKIIYADCDSIFLDSLLPLWHEYPVDKMILGVWDHVGFQSKLKVGLSENTKYINSGFLVIDLNKWRSNNAEEKIIAFITEKKGKVDHHDQGIINGCFPNEIGILPPLYNVMTSFFDFKNVTDLKNYYQSPEYYSQELISWAKNNPVFLHFTPCFSKRPWIAGTRHPLAFKYKIVKDKSPWKSVSAEKDNRPLKNIYLERIFWMFGSTFYRIFTEFLIKIKPHAEK